MRKLDYEEGRELELRKKERKRLKKERREVRELKHWEEKPQGTEN